MRSISFPIVEHLVRGLREDSRKRIDQRRLVEAKGVIVDEDRLSGYVGPTDPFSPAKSVSFPFPQLLRGKSVTLLAEESALSLVDESDYSETSLSLVDKDGNAASITSDGTWHLADLEDAWYATNGTSLVFKTGLQKMAGAADVYYVEDLGIRSVCEHQGRVICGGLSSGFWSGLSSIFDSWKSGSEPAGVDLPYNELTDNWVAYSTPGFADIPLWTIWPSGETYDLAPTADDMLRRFRSNSLGWLPMPFQGAVQRVMSLGQHVIVYGEDGVVALTPLTGEAPTFRQRTVLRGTGLYDRGSVGGDQLEHVFLDTRGDLWRLGADLGLEKLGYAEYLSQLNVGDVAVSLNSQDRKYYVSGAENFVLSGTGLSGPTPEKVTSGYFLEGGFVGLAEDDGDTAVALKTAPFDMSVKGIKRVNFVEVQLETDQDVELALEYKYDNTGTWTQSRWIPLNTHGFAYFGVSGTEFRLMLKLADYSGLKIDYVIVGYQTSDKRARRGPVADTTGARRSER